MMNAKYVICLIILCFLSHLSLYSGIVYFISGPSAAGKTTLANALIAECGNEGQLENYVFYTTRPKRAGELEAVDYYFITQEEFQKKEQEGYFLHSFQYDHFLYGYEKSILAELEKGKSYIILTEYNSTKLLQELIPSSISIWIDVKEITTLEERLLRRHADDLDKFYRRYHLAIEEREQERIAPSCQYHILNDDFEEAKQQLKSLICKET